jgi:hypothetical protein
VLDGTRIISSTHRSSLPPQLDNIPKNWALGTLVVPLPKEVHEKMFKGTNVFISND